MIQTQSKKLTKVAQQEVEAGLVPFENLELASNNGEKARKAKLSK